MNRCDVIVRPEPLGSLPENFGSRPLLVEIGFGNGDFLAHLASHQPDAGLYGIEVSMTCVEKALSRVLRQDLNNVKLLCGDARFLLRECFHDNSVERIYMSFPCPWPKERHARRRVTAEGFSATIAAVLQPGGVFELATDEGWYADEVDEILGAHKALTLQERKLNHRQEITTKYENKWLEMKKDIHHLYFAKTAQWTVERSITGSGGVEHMHIRVEPAVQITAPELSRHLAGVTGRIEGSDGTPVSVWAYHGIYSADDVILVETICTDQGFEQKFYCKIVTRPECTLVKLDGVHLPYLTPSVRSALQNLADLLKAR